MQKLYRNDPDMRRNTLSLFSSLLVLLLATAPVSAHDFWIRPSTFKPELGQKVDLSLHVGQDLKGDTLPYINDWFSDYRVVTPRGARPIDAIMGDDPAGSFTVDGPGGYLVGYRSTRDFVALDPVKFRNYLLDEGLDHIVALRERRGSADLAGPEFYSRCAKALLQAGTAREPETYKTSLGYTLELVPELDPYTLQPGKSLPIRIFYKGEPLENVLIVAFNTLAPADKQKIRSDSAGRAIIPLNRSGMWLVKAVHMIDLTALNSRADWESYWASLTFELPSEPKS